MKIIQWIAGTMLMLIVTGFLFRGWLYRQCITYHAIGQRTTYGITNPKLAHYIEENSEKRENPNIQQIIREALSITNSRLNFTAGKNDIDPNQLIHSCAAHCVGYAAFFATTCNDLLQRHHLDDQWIAVPRAGQLYFLGTNIHQYTNSTFFKDHDFVTIENKTTGETFAVDPTVSDCFGIDFVTYAQ